MSHIWLRHEYKPDERRAPITPEQVGQLVGLGHKVSVESSQHRVFSDARYSSYGAETVPAGSWHRAPKEAFILGIKEVLQEQIDADNLALQHRHIYFAHVFKGQRCTPETMRRFTLGKGTLLDLEYLVNEAGHRVAAFSYSAGFAGAIAAVHIWAEKKLGNLPPYKLPNYHLSRRDFIDEVKLKLAIVDALPTALIVGANGKSGRGAADLFATLDIVPAKWGREETRAGGPFAEMLGYDILCNCVFITEQVAPFLSIQLLSEHGQHKLSVIADVSNDLSYNPIFGISTSTRFSDATIRIGDIDVIEIENLPVLTPLNSSLEYANQLFPYLLDLVNAESQKHSIWEKAALKYFEHHDMPQIGMESGRELGEAFLDRGQTFGPKIIRQHLMEILAKNPLGHSDRRFFKNYLFAGAAEVLVTEEDKERFNTYLAKTNLDEIYDSPAMLRHHALLKAINGFVRSQDFDYLKPLETRNHFFEMCDYLAQAIDGEKEAMAKYVSTKTSLAQKLGEVWQNPAIKEHFDTIEQSADLSLGQV